MSDASACYLVWLSFMGKPFAQKWWKEQGTVIGGRAPFLQQHKLSCDEERLTLGELIKRYPAPVLTSE